MSDRKMPKSDKAVSWHVRDARKEAEALAFTVEALELCDADGRGRVLAHVMQILGISVQSIQDAKVSP